MQHHGAAHLLTAAARQPFTVVRVRARGADAVELSVDSERAAHALLRLSGKVKYLKRALEIRRLDGSDVDATAVSKESAVYRAVQQALASRFDASLQRLDLSNLVAVGIAGVDATFSSCARAICDVIAEQYPQLQQLSLARNRLLSLAAYAGLGKAAPRLAILDLSDNKLDRIGELDTLKSLTCLRQLSLIHNPLQRQQRYRAEVADMALAMRRRFPLLEMLDGERLPSVASLPPRQRCFAQSDTLTAFANGFVPSYFALYDRPNVREREGLLPLYAESCVFSLSVTARAVNLAGPGPLEPGMRTYMALSRNLKHVADAERRADLLKCGRNSVIATLCGLPATRHHYADAAVDVWWATVRSRSGAAVPPAVVRTERDAVAWNRTAGRPKGHCAAFDGPLRGHCRARPSDDAPLQSRLALRAAAAEQRVRTPHAAQCASPRTVNRAASRSPRNRMQALIANDALHVMPMPEGAAGGLLWSGGIHASASVGAEAAAQAAEIQRLSQMTGMNEAFSRDCLQSNHWNFAAALENFQQLQAEHKIPPAAFQR